MSVFLLSCLMLSRVAEGAETADAAIAHLEAAAARGSTEAMVDLGRLYLARERYDEAIAVLERARAARDREGADAGDHWRIQAVHALADAHKWKGDHVEAERLYREVIQSAKPDDVPHYVRTSLASIYERQGRYADAEPLLRAELARIESKAGSGHPDVLRVLSPLAVALEAQDRREEAEPLLRRAVAVAEARLDAGSPAIGEALVELGRFLQKKGDHAAARPLLERAVAVLSPKVEADDYQLLGAQASLMAVHAGRGDLARLSAVAESALTGLVKHEAAPRHFVWLMLDVAQHHLSRAPAPVAEAHCRGLMGVMTRVLGPGHPALGQVMGIFAASVATRGPSSLLRELREVACEAGHAPACNDLGAMHGLGEGGAEKDHARELALYKRACDAGVGPGCSNLGYLYQVGEGAPVDLGQAVAYYRKACELGSTWGCFNLAVMLAEGEGTDKDPKQAAALYGKACQDGVAPSCTNLGSLHEDGRGVEKDLGRAASLYRQGCDGANAVGCHHLGVLHLEGKGVSRDPAQAAELFKRACDGGYTDACERLKPNPGPTPAAFEGQ